MPYYEGWMHGGWMWLWWALPIVGLGWVAWMSRLGRRPSKPPTAEQVLRRRFAAGEIGERGYRTRLAVLRVKP